jgi:predicted AAA+ superfamily ATPase
MITKNTIKKTIVEQRKIFLETTGFIKREILCDKKFLRACDLKEAVIVTGVRRSGKSFLLRLIWKKLKEEKKIKSDNFLYVNFEDEKLIDFWTEDFEVLLESYFELFELGRKRKIYLFFDEIQNVSGWEKFVNRLLEAGTYKIFITGSNASLLSREIGTALTGRSVGISLFPLSFREFAVFKLGRLPQKRKLFERDTRVALKKLFEEYSENGGFPEVVLQNFRPLLQEYLRNIIYRDIVLRYQIRSEINLREITSFVVSNIGVILSLEKIRKMTKMKNLMTIKNYLSYLENSFLFYLVPKYSHSVKEQIYNPDKIYVIDPGMYREISFATSPNSGRALENIVFLELKRRGGETYYFKEKNECDFLIKDKGNIQAVQVTKTLSRENEDREVSGLSEVMKKFNLKTGLIITDDQEDELKRESELIRVFPAWKWLLGLD